ncbi:uncharacterized protein LOC106140307 [Amyelois transitella]|uniref:uncharacterized protein LOC106140307 n=1 Tax=Amyelois transitella TaxID=680683 RepID=UPI00298FF953|nr:uncharacterized protein LOC106140307 [Amyelois transitella]
MVLLSPSVEALRGLLRVCETFAETHGLSYNTKKSEVMVFNVGRKTTDCPQHIATLRGIPLKRVTQFKYLGHIVTEDLSDNLDMERERRALAVRCGVVALRFAKCNAEVKVTLFRAFCQTFYTCSLWVNYTARAAGALRVQYNNAFRALMGLPRFCSASGMFANANVDDYYAIIRKRTASLMRRVRCSPNGVMNIIANKLESPIWVHWYELHVSNNVGLEK